MGSGHSNVVTSHPESFHKSISVGLLTGSTPAKVRREITSRASDGSLDLLIGTHTLIQSGIDLPNLALAVMDEQHRFGVVQRSELRQQGLENPHSLVLSATPIPRTLSLTLYGDLDISTLDELPPGRQPIPTRFVDSDRSEEHTSELQSLVNLVCRLLLEKKNKKKRRKEKKKKTHASEIWR